MSADYKAISTTPCELRKAQMQLTQIPSVPDESEVTRPHDEEDCGNLA